MTPAFSEKISIGNPWGALTDSINRYTSTRCSLVRGVRVNGKLNTIRVPCCSTFNSSTVSRERGMGGSGSPILPQTTLKKTRRQGDKETRKERKLNRPCLLVSLSSCLLVRVLQDVTTEVFILNDVSEHLLNIDGVYHLVFFFQIGTFERNF